MNNMLSLHSMCVCVCGFWGILREMREPFKIIAREVLTTQVNNSGTKHPYLLQYINKDIIKVSFTALKRRSHVHDLYEYPRLRRKHLINGQFSPFDNM